MLLQLVIGVSDTVELSNVVARIQNRPGDARPAIIVTVPELVDGNMGSPRNAAAFAPSAASAFIGE